MRCRTGTETLLGGSWVVISGVMSPLIWVITIVTRLITPLIPTHEPPSSRGRGREGLRGSFHGTVLLQRLGTWAKCGFRASSLRFRSSVLVSASGSLDLLDLGFTVYEV